MSTSLSSRLSDLSKSQTHWPRQSYTVLPHRHHPIQRQQRHVTVHGFFDKVFKSFQNSTEQDDEDDDNTFVELNTDSTGSVDGTSEQTFGPLAILAVGFLRQEFDLVQNFLDDIGADEIGLVPCTSDMLGGSLGEALLQSQDPPEHENPALGARRVLFLSGMYASEVMEVVSGYKADGLPDAAFAAAVPKSWNRRLDELIQDVAEDHAKMAQRRAEMALEAAQQAAALEQQENNSDDDGDGQESKEEES